VIGAVLIFDELDALQLVEALTDRLRWARDNTSPCRPFIRHAAETILKRLTEDQGGSTLAEILAVLDARPMPAQLLLTYQDAAAALAVSVPTVKRLVASGALRAVKVGGAVRIAMVDLEDYARSLTPRPLSERIEHKNGARP
jgi:excisionase family DNA binding protein